MMDRERLQARLMATFVVELQEHIVSLNQDFLALENAKSFSDAEPVIDSLFRTAHSLKGAGRAVGLLVIEKACHALEDLLSAAKTNRRMLGASLFPYLFATADAIEDLGARLQEGRDLAGNTLEAAVATLSTAESQGAVAVSQGAPPTLDLEPEKVSTVPDVPVAPLVNTATAAAVPGVAPSTSMNEAAGASVRVPAEKLDTLLSRSGELLVAKRSIEERISELMNLRAALARSNEDWRRLEKPLMRRLSTSAGVAPAFGKGRMSKEQLNRALGRFSERLRRVEKDLDRLATGMSADGRRIDRAAAEIDGEVRRLRMLPFGEACQGLDRVVRDLAKSLGKKAEIRIEGSNFELDRSILQGLKDPLLHLVRNAIDHAIESPLRRVAVGKSEVGKITVSAALRSGQVRVVVEDDGAGFDLAALRAKARREGLAEPADESEAGELIFRPGISTATTVTSVSGRGVGLDVVKSRVESLHGTIDVESQSGVGTRFILGVPLTLTTMRALLVGAAGQVFAISATNVRRLVKIAPDDLRSVRGRQVLMIDGVPWPVATLATVLGLTATNFTTAPARQHAMLVAAGERRVALLVDTSLAEQEIVVKTLGSRVVRVVNLAGATILPSGEIALVLNAADLVRSALDGAFSPSVVSTPAVTEAERRRLLVVDDSITTRTLEQTILESAGFEVRTASDGQAGWQTLNEYGADLVVSDVDMPRMDGFTLTQTIRSSDRFRDLPVILVTARATDSDRARGVEVGADAYLTKSTFDQVDLLAAVSRLL